MPGEEKGNVIYQISSIPIGKEDTLCLLRISYNANVKKMETDIFQEGSNSLLVNLEFANGRAVVTTAAKSCWVGEVDPEKELRVVFSDISLF